MTMFHTTGVLAAKLGTQSHNIRTLIERGAIPHTRAGTMYLIADTDLPKVREELVRAGYISESILGVPWSDTSGPCGTASASGG